MSWCRYALALCAVIVGCSGEPATDGPGSTLDAAAGDGSVAADASSPDASGGASGAAGQGGSGGSTADAAPPTDAASPDASSPACPTSGKTPPAYTGVNTNPNFVQLYVNNIENLETPTDQCKGDWKDLIYYMKLNQSPDLFLVQQLSGQAQMDQLSKFMSDNLPGVFDGVIAEANPKVMNSPCGPPKDYQTNAIIYRTGRFSPVGAKHTFQVQSFQGGMCQKNFQSRTIAVMQKFLDTKANKHVTVASIHWSTFQGTGADPACAEANAQQMANQLKKADFEADLFIWGGDANEGDRNASNAYKGWYQAVNGDLGGALGFRDGIYAKCAAGGGGIKACLDDNWTIGSGNRIDFAFAKRGDGCLPIMTRAHTVTYEEADAAAQQVAGGDSSANYSDHRAVKVEVHY